MPDMKTDLKLRWEAPPARTAECKPRPTATDVCNRHNIYWWQHLGHERCTLSSCGVNCAGGPEAPAACPHCGERGCNCVAHGDCPSCDCSPEAKVNQRELQEARDVVDCWEALEGESMREGHRATLERLIAEGLQRAVESAVEKACKAAITVVVRLGR